MKTAASINVPMTTSSNGLNPADSMRYSAVIVKTTVATNAPPAEITR